MQIYRQGANYGGAGADKLVDVFEGLDFDPFVKGYLIAPVTGRSLEPVSNPKLTDYLLTIDDVPVDHYQQYATMQRVLGLPTELTTAIIIDTSAYINSIDRAKLRSAINSYFDAIINSTNEVIKNQKIVLWSYADTVTNHVTNPIKISAATKSTLLAAVDDIITNWDNDGDGSARNEAIVTAIGGYKGSDLDMFDPVEAPTYVAQQPLWLNDGYIHDDDAHTLDKLLISNIVLIGNGAASHNIFTVQAAKEALMSESLIVYDRNAKGEASTDDSGNSPTVYLGKPLFYIVLGDDQADSEFAALTTKIGVGQNYNFASNLIAAQQSAVSARSSDNRYLVRYAVRERSGIKSDIRLASRTNGYNFALTTEWDLDEAMTGIIGQKPLLPKVEITTAKNEFFAGGRVRLSDATRLYPATRYTVIKYLSSNYEWTVDGSIVTADSDGSIEIDENASSVTLKNILLNQSVTLNVE